MAMKACIYRISVLLIFLCVQCNAQSLPSPLTLSLPALAVQDTHERH